ncbi:MAG: HD domain-containing protein [SAR324 cluster bacterium]|nr:HD domain-containing protein [SAR324 cluster bacterium]
MTSEKLFDAVEFATRAHRGQFRKTLPSPYILHPLRVGHWLIRYQLPEDVVVAGILHDVVEDTPFTLSEIEQRFGVPVAQMVREVSEPDKTLSWEDRKRHTLEAIATLPLESLCIICADKLDNMLSLAEEQEFQGNSFWDVFNRPYDQQHWYYHNLRQTLSVRLERSSFAELFHRLNNEIFRVFP